MNIVEISEIISNFSTALYPILGGLAAIAFQELNKKNLLSSYPQSLWEVSA